MVGGVVDMIVWDGLEDGHDVTVVLLDIKTGRASANAQQRKIRDAVEAHRVQFRVVPFRPAQEVTVPELIDIPPGMAIGEEELDAELIEATDDNPNWEEHIGGNVVFADTRLVRDHQPQPPGTPSPSVPSLFRQS